MRRWEVNGYPIASCGGCSLVFVQTIVTPDELAEHYTSGSDPTYDETDNLDCLSYYYRRLRGLIETVRPEPGRLLDVGCAAGSFLDVMNGWECYGNEIVESYIQIARRSHGDRIFAGSFEEYPIQHAYFDVITLQDVLDHMRDPIAPLRQCHALLKPNGLLVIKVHNISCLYARIAGKHFYAIIPPSHLFYYNKRTLKMLLETTGFRLLDTKFIAHLLKVQTVLFRLSRNNPQTAAYRMYRRIAGSWMGGLKLRKNLRDVITVLAIRE